LVVRKFGIEPKDIVKLASNENPTGCSPKVAKAIAQNAHKAYLYPDDSFHELKDALSKRFAIQSNNIIIGAGSDQILEFISRALLNPNESVLMSRVTFAMYEIYAKQMGAKIIRTPSFQHKVDEFITSYRKEKPKIVYLCTPNNPTGDGITKESVFEIIDAVSENSLVVIDGAYMEYAQAKDKSYEIKPKDILHRPNVIYLGTFSKAYGLGGMRVGYGLSNRDIIYSLHKLRPPFNITTLSLASAIEDLNKKSAKFVKATIKDNFKQMSRYEKWAKEHGLEFIPSYTNFITIKLGDYDSSVVAKELLQIGIIVRDLASYGLNAIRITIGKKEQNKIVLERLSEILKTV
jgi:histidinol-phosphate aminotransferase